MLTRGAARVIALAGLLTVALPAMPGRLGDPAHAAAPPCRVDRFGAAKLEFAAVLTKGGRVKQGEEFELNEITDLLIKVRWRTLNQSARQRVELYSPNGHLFQMFTATLPKNPDPVDIRVPVVGSWIREFSLAGPWCVKVFLDDNATPSVVDLFELRLRRRR
jgi:hypothetical protein